MSAKWISLGIVVVALAIGTVWYMTKPKHVLASRGSIGLENVVIPSNVTAIENGAFKKCTSLRSVIIPEGVTSIGMSAFANCTNLESVTIPKSVTYIQMGAFSGCNKLARVIIPNGVTEIDWFAFCMCEKLVTIVIPNGVTSIRDSAFAGCSNLKSVTIPNGVTSIGGNAFMGCSNLKSVTIPASVAKIGEDAFAGCSNLKSVTIPNGVTSIGDSAFMGCSNLKSVTIPASVVKIGEDAFAVCHSLKITVAADNPKYTSVSGELREKVGASAENGQEEHTDAVADTRITVKGLYIGMDFKTVSAILTEKLSGTDWKPYEIAINNTVGVWIRDSTTGEFTADPRATDIIVGDLNRPNDTDLFNQIRAKNATDSVILKGCGLIVADKDGKVIGIVMGKRLVNALFKADGLDDEQFVQQFIDSYNIPKMKRTGASKYAYTSPDGVKVVLEERILAMAKVPSTKECKQSFD